MSGTDLWTSVVTGISFHRNSIQMTEILLMVTTLKHSQMDRCFFLFRMYFVLHIHSMVMHMVHTAWNGALSACPVFNGNVRSALVEESQCSTELTWQLTDRAKKKYRNLPSPKLSKAKVPETAWHSLKGITGFFSQTLKAMDSIRKEDSVMIRLKLDYTN